MSLTEQPLLRVHDLELAYEASGAAFWQRRLITAVTGVTFEIRAGETLGLVGESGSGKSTTGKAILRQMPIAGGSIEFDGKSIDVGARAHPCRIVATSRPSSRTPRRP